MDKEKRKSYTFWGAVSPTDQPKTLLSVHSFENSSLASQTEGMVMLDL